MSGSAWFMMLATWSVIAFFTVRFFLAVLNKGGAKGSADSGSDPKAASK